MPWTYRIDKADGIVFVKLTGSFDTQSTTVAQNRVRDDPNFDPGYRALYDLRDVTDVELTSSDMKMLGKNSPFDGSGRRAFVVSEAAMYGMTRMYLTRRNEKEGRVQLFDDVAEARMWLDLRV